VVVVTEVIKGVLIGLAVSAAVIAVIFILRPAQSPEPIFVPATFSPAPVPPHCTTATLGAGLHGLPRCKP
jgi:hypothetical protein